MDVALSIDVDAPDVGEPLRGICGAADTELLQKGQLPRCVGVDAVERNRLRCARGECESRRRGQCARPVGINGHVYCATVRGVKRTSSTGRSQVAGHEGVCEDHGCRGEDYAATST
jgi:hypothetical protein